MYNQLCSIKGLQKNIIINILMLKFLCTNTECIFPTSTKLRNDKLIKTLQNHVVSTSFTHLETFLSNLYKIDQAQ